ncbi:unnamed protein product [Paramecium octaurelia]|uniref:Ammonium transporter AmtB-like domain-containing protein n=1 Tax=Paramecium octaurelia TaxID=43137 RepID=A0A8S1SD27_PAROT|nr:unnamed protein product [Paramecium octaurelia]
MQQHYLDSSNTANPPPAASNQPAGATGGSHLDEDWLLIAGIVLAFSQLGFGFLEAGSVRYKNAQSIVIKVFLGMCLTILIYWLFGYGFSYGDDFGTFFLGGTKLGAYNWAATEAQNDYSNFVFKATLSCIGVSIVSGGAAERLTFLAWGLLALFYSGFVSPAIVHWTNSNGWLTKLGYKDMAGSGFIFYSAGVAALVVTVVSKPRKYRFDPNSSLNFQPFTSIYVAFGTVILFATWMFINGGQIQSGQATPYVQGLVAVNTLVAGAAGGFWSFITRYFTKETTSLFSISRGILAGLVASSAAAHESQIWATAIVASIAGIVYTLTATALPKVKLDDPVQVVPIFLHGGFIGVLFTGLLDVNGGLFYGKGMKLLGCQLLGLLIITVWVAFFVFFILIVLKGFAVLRIDSDAEVAGIDKEKCNYEAISFSNEDQQQVNIIKSVSY